MPDARILVTGSRSWSNPELLADTLLDTWHDGTQLGYDSIVILHGDADGADTSPTSGPAATALKSRPILRTGHTAVPTARPATARPTGAAPSTAPPPATGATSAWSTPAPTSSSASPKAPPQERATACAEQRRPA